MSDIHRRWVEQLLQDAEDAERREKEWRKGCFAMMLVALYSMGTFLVGYVTEDGDEVAGNETVVVYPDGTEEGDPPQADPLDFVTSEVSFDLSDPEAVPETRVLAETVIGEVTAADLVVMDDGLASEVVLVPDQTTFYSVSQHRYVITAEGAAIVVHLFGSRVDPEGRDSTMISLSLVADGLTTPGPVTATLAVESGGTIFLLPDQTDLTDTGQSLDWETIPEALLPVEEDATLDGSEPFRLGVALVVAATQPGDARFETHFAEPTATVGFAETGPRSGF